MPSSSDRIASEFMSQGRPAGDGVQSSGSRPGDVSSGLEIKTPQFGTGFAEWAVSGFDLCGGIKTEGESNRHPEPPGETNNVKTDRPQVVVIAKK